MQDETYALKHKLRRSIYAYVTENPGATYGRLKRMFSLTDSTLRYHLGYLAKHDKIACKMENGKKCYYPEPEERTYGEVDGINRSSYSNNQLDILNFLKGHPGATRKDVQTRLHMEKDAVAYSLRRLSEQKVVWKRRRGRDTVYEVITQDGLRKEMMAILMERFLKGDIDEQRFLQMKKRLDERFSQRTK